MKRTILNIAVGLLRAVYAPHKLFPTKNRVLYLSRQRNNTTEEIDLLLKRIQELDPSIEVHAISRKIPAGLLGKLGYCIHLGTTELHYLATSKVVLLDGYSIPVSVLTHKDSLTVVQIWHALGILKKFGRMVADEDEGYDQDIIEIMHMHANYNHILCSSEFCVPFYAEAFGYPESMVHVMPLPRVDMLKNTERTEEKRAAFFAAYPALAEKQTVLYAPTLRKQRNASAHIEHLRAALDPQRYNLVVKLHPTEGPAPELPGVFTCPDFSAVDMLSVASAVITDYSAICFEAAVADVPVYFYTYDLDEYMQERGFCIDFEHEMPHVPVRTAKEVAQQISQGTGEQVALNKFVEKFVAHTTDATDNIAHFVISLCAKSHTE